MATKSVHFTESGSTKEGGYDHETRGVIIGFLWSGIRQKIGTKYTRDRLVSEIRTLEVLWVIKYGQTMPRSGRPGYNFGINSQPDAKIIRPMSPCYLFQEEKRTVDE